MWFRHVVDGTAEANGIPFVRFAGRAQAGGHALALGPDGSRGTLWGGRAAGDRPY